MMELRTTDDPQSMDLVDATGKVGYLVFVEADEEDPGEGWVAHVAGADKSWDSKPAPTVLEAAAAANEFYDELVARRATREQWMKAALRAQPRTVSIPMGGAPRR